MSLVLNVKVFVRLGMLTISVIASDMPQRQKIDFDEKGCGKHVIDIAENPLFFLVDLKNY